MQVQRLSILFVLTLCGIITIPQVESFGLFGKGGEEPLSPIRGLLKRDSRIISIFSKPPPQKEEKHDEEKGDKPEIKDSEDSSSLLGHVGNVLKGGTIGFKLEARPLAPVHGLIDRAKGILHKPFIPGIHKPEAVPKEQPPAKIPDKIPPVKNPDEKPKGKPEAIETEEEWVHQDNKKPNIDGPKWEDIGEANVEYDYGSLDVIQPRKRPKRFVESKIYHVPLEFMSNAKPVHVQIKADDNFLNKIEPK